jgi:hypothetical protein
VDFDGVEYAEEACSEVVAVEAADDPGGRYENDGNGE